MSSPVNELQLFQSILNFVTDINELYGSKMRKLQLYHRLLSKTTASNYTAIQKHFTAFKTFFLLNDISTIESISSPISYNERIQIELPYIIKQADHDSLTNIKKHLLLIKSLLFPEDKESKNMLISSAKTEETNQKMEGNEEKFIGDLMNKVKSKINPSEIKDPMQAVTSIMSSGLLNDILQSMDSSVSNGDLDLNKLMGTVTTMFSNLNK